MRGRHVLGLAAAPFVVAFLVPVHTFDGVTFFGRIHGDIFLWETWRIQGWRDAPSAAISLIPCAFFVATWLIAFFRPGRLRRGFTWAAWAFAAYQAFAIAYGLHLDYGVGAGTWALLASFVLLGLALHRTRREVPRAPGERSTVALE